MNNRQIGKFKIAEEIIRNSTEHIANVFSLMRIVPVRCEVLFHERAIEYIGYSYLFDEVDEGMMIPEYLIEVSVGEDGNPESVKVKKVVF